MSKVLTAEIQISQNFLNHLIRHYPYIEVDFYFGKTLKFLCVDDKNYKLESNKKYLVNKIFNLEADNWKTLGVPTLRKKIKKFIDGWR